ncbi:hypothetical protein QAD02_009999 [Eretmocerus hayati]|uniref:Uncharacterized protein n=1 Tax=Eretmocerus hayati TaxID=131215 RepID=A0ACC2NC93_9HYME|nr:hypothetical protein QAD02_009999 [Eretmocerus hayati]
MKIFESYLIFIWLITIVVAETTPRSISKSSFEKPVFKNTSDGKLLMELGKREEADTLDTTLEINLYKGNKDEQVVRPLREHKITMLSIKYPKKFKANVSLPWTDNGILREATVFITPEKDAPKTNLFYEVNVFGKRMKENEKI